MGLALLPVQSLAGMQAILLWIRLDISIPSLIVNNIHCEGKIDSIAWGISVGNGIILSEKSPPGNRYVLTLLMYDIDVILCYWKACLAVAYNRFANTWCIACELQC